MDQSRWLRTWRQEGSTRPMERSSDSFPMRARGCWARQGMENMMEIADTLSLPSWHTGGPIVCSELGRTNTDTRPVACRKFGETFKWLLYGDDDTIFFPEAVKKLVRNFNPDLPHAITGKR
jgi:hypothetical protein